MSVWVEIVPIKGHVYLEKSSRSTWACELKCARQCQCGILHCHAPRERVSWNRLHLEVARHDKSHAPRERVSWNVEKWHSQLRPEGHAPRERVSWNAVYRNSHNGQRCHAPRERVSWNAKNSPFARIVLSSRSTWACELKLAVHALATSPGCHAPRERVSWNLFHLKHCPIWLVTLHVSVWVEMPATLKMLISPGVTLHVSVWVEIKRTITRDLSTARHAPRERVSWNPYYRSYLPGRFGSRSTWACELKYDNISIVLM